MVQQGGSEKSKRSPGAKSTERLRLNRPSAVSRRSRLKKGAQQSRRDWGGTVVVPLVVALVAFGGGALGSWSSNRANDNTIAAEKEQTVEQFRRDQRRDIYAEILKAGSRLDNATENLGMKITAAVMSGELANRRSTDAPPDLSQLYERLEPIRTEWEAVYAELDTAISDAELSSGRAVITLAYAMRDRYKLDFYERFDPLTYPPRISDGLPRFRRSEIFEENKGRPYDSSLLDKPVDELRAMLISEAQADLALNDR